MLHLCIFFIGLAYLESCCSEWGMLWLFKLTLNETFQRKNCSDAEFSRHRECRSLPPLPQVFELLRRLPANRLDDRRSKDNESVALVTQLTLLSDWSKCLRIHARRAAVAATLFLPADGAHPRGRLDGFYTRERAESPHDPRGRMEDLARQRRVQGPWRPLSQLAGYLLEFTAKRLALGGGHLLVLM